MLQDLGLQPFAIRPGRLAEIGACALSLRVVGAAAGLLAALTTYAAPAAPDATAASTSAQSQPTTDTAPLAGAKSASPQVPIEIIVVTGTRGTPRSVTTTPVPVDVISAEQIASAGALGGEFGQALQNLVPSFNFQRQSNSGSADIVRPAQLRGMSPDQVLVLVSGKRRHTTAITGTDAKTGRGTAPVDFNSLPTNAISRIEVLRDGAGAEYGSDAIAGVINVILDERPSGFEANVTAGEHVTKFTPVNKDIRDGKTYSGDAALGMPLGEHGFLRAGVEYKDRGDTNRAGRDAVPFFEDEANIPLVGGQRNYKPGDGSAKDLNLWFNSATAVSTDVDFYSFGTYNHRDAEGTGFFRYPVGSANILAVYPLGYRPVTTGRNEDIGLTGGLRGDVAKWRWDVSASYGRNTFKSGVKNSLNPSLGAASPHSFRSGIFANDMLAVNVDAYRPLPLGLSTPATLSIGGEFRRHAFESHAGDAASFAAGPLAAPPDSLAIGAQAGGGLRPDETRSLDRKVSSAYVELAMDVTRDVFVDLATRYEDSDDFGGALAGKLSARWEFADGFALRGAISNSFRAPSLVQLGFGTSSSSFGEGGQLTTVNTLPVDDPVARALGASDLNAEKSRNFSVGVTGNFAIGLVVTMDLFRIDVDDRITLSERIDCSADNVPDTAVIACAARNITAASFFTNAANTRTDGVDIVASYGAPVWDGTLDLTAGLSYAQTRIRSVNAPAIAGVVLVGVEERNTIQDATPKRKAIFTANWKDDSWSALARFTYFGKATRVFNFGGGFEPTQTYGAEWQVDTELGYQVSSSVRLNVGVSNLFDSYPDRSISDISFFDNLPYDVLSPLGFNGRFVYATAKLAL